MHMTERLTPEKSPWGWKALFIFCILGGIFMFIFWLAVTNEPDYMPSQKRKQAAEAAAQQAATDAKMANATTLESNTEMAMPEANSADATSPDATATDGTTKEMDHTEQHAH